MDAVGIQHGTCYPCACAGRPRKGRARRQATRGSVNAAALIISKGAFGKAPAAKRGADSSSSSSVQAKRLAIG